MKNYDQFLLEAKKKTSLEQKWWNAIFNRDMENGMKKIKSLIEQGVDINVKSNVGSTALIDAAAFSNNMEFIKLLLAQPNIDVNIQDNNEDTALTKAALYGREPIVKLLLTHPKIDITILNWDGGDFYMNTLNKAYLIDYDLQKKILDNGRDDIILFFNKNNLVQHQIKKEYPHLFTGVELNLL